MVLFYINPKGSFYYLVNIMNYYSYDVLFMNFSPKYLRSSQNMS